MAIYSMTIFLRGLREWRNHWLTLLDISNHGDEPMESLPEGSEILLMLVAVSGVSTWYLSNFTQNETAVRLTAIIGVASMMALLGLVLL